jgi:hypothetical protein
MEQVFVPKKREGREDACRLCIYSVVSSECSIVKKWWSREDFVLCVGAADKLW